MNNMVDDLLVLRHLGVVSMPRKAPKILPICWLLPNAICIKVNIDMAAVGAPSVADGGVCLLLMEHLSKCVLLSL